MNNVFVMAVDKTVAFCKQFNLKQLFVVLLAGLILVTTTACNPPAPKVVGEGSYNERVGQVKELYDPIQKPTGGMNTYNDNEPSINRKVGDTRAKALTDNAKTNLNKRAANPKEIIDNAKDAPPVNQQLKSWTGSVGDRVGDATEDFSEGTKRGVRNLKSNIENAGDAVKDSAGDAAQDAKGLGRDIQKQADRTAKDLSK